MAVRILNEKKSTTGSPYVYYSVYYEEVAGSRTANSVDLNIQGVSHLASASSTLGSGSNYTLTGYLQIKGTEYSITLKGKNESWSGTTNHSSTPKRITISNLLPSDTTITGIKFRVARGSGSTSSAGYLASTSCSNISISLGHDNPSDVVMTMQEMNGALTGVSDNVIVENLSQKKLSFTYLLHDNADRTYVGVMNATNYYRSALEQDNFTIDFSQNTLTKVDNKIPLLPFVEDDLGGFGVDQWTYYTFIPYTNISITNSTTKAKRLGQTSGRVGLDINGVFYNGVVGNTDQSTLYKPTIKYKYWKVGDTEPLTYANTISASDITITDNTFSVSSLDIGSSTETDPNYFDPEYSYRIKIQASDSFTTTESNELQIQVGEAIWTEFKDRVDFKKLSIDGDLIDLKDISTDIDFTGGVSYVNSQFRKFGNMVFISYQSTALTHSNNELLFTMPQELYPTEQVFAVCTLNANAYGLVAISSATGQCTINQLSSTPSSNTRVYFQITYFIK